MSAWSPQQKQLIGVLLLLVVIVLALFMASIPRWNYRYPIHSDEWTHYGATRSLMETTRISYPDPGEGGAAFSPDIEIGFHVLLAELKLATRLSWPDIFRLVPGIIFAMLVFQVYAMTGRKWPGLIAAFLAALIPTTVRFLGPAFLVPAALGLTFIPLILLILRRFMTDRKGPVFLAFSLFSLLFIHPPTFIVVSIIAMVQLIFHLLPGKKGGGGRRLMMLSLCGIGAIYVFALFWASSYIRYNINEALTPRPELPLPPIADIIARFGYIPPFLFAAGMGILAYRGTRQDRAMGLSALGLLVFQLLYAYFFVGPDIIYERGWLYLYVLMALIGGRALVDVWRWLRDFLERRAVTAIAGYGVVAGLLVLSLGLSLRGHLAEPYYHLVDDATYQEFLWVREYVGHPYQTGVTDIGVGSPFAAVSGKYVYIGEVSPNFRIKAPRVSEFFKNNATDTRWLTQERINIVYTEGQVDNNALNRVNRNLYLLIEDPED